MMSRVSFPGCSTQRTSRWPFLPDTHLDTNHIKAFVSTHLAQDTVSYCLMCRDPFLRKAKSLSILYYLQARLFYYWQDGPLAKGEQSKYCPAIEHWRRHDLGSDDSRWL